MNKKIFVIYDSEENYAKKICQYISAKAGDVFELYLFTKKEPLLEFVGREPAEILLASGLSEEEAKNTGFYIRLSDSYEEECGENTVYKYSPADVILRKVMKIIEGSKDTGEKRIGKGQMKVIGFYSPIKRCFQSTCALTMGQILSRKKKTLYIGFEPYSGLDHNGKDGNDIMDLLYFSECGSDISIQVCNMADRIGDLQVIQPVRHFEKYRDITKAQWVRLIKKLKDETDIEVLILDLSEQIDGLFDVMDECDEVYTIEVDGKTASRKLGRFDALLREEGYIRLADRIKKLSIPVYKGIPDEPEMLPYSQLAGYLSEIMDDRG